MDSEALEAFLCLIIRIIMNVCKCRTIQTVHYLQTVFALFQDALFLVCVMYFSKSRLCSINVVRERNNRNRNPQVAPAA